MSFRFDVSLIYQFINDNNITNEQIKRSPIDKMSLYKSYLETNKLKIMTMIYHDLDELFYGLAD